MDDFDDYQKQALETDQFKDAEQREGVIVPLLGLAGEAGALLTEYKKSLRDGDAYTRLEEGMREELGDVLWYVAVLADRFDLSLADVARQNLVKVRGRWARPDARTLLDEGFPPEEQLPRRFTVRFADRDNTVRVYVDDEQVGDPIRDNSYQETLYRYHDIFHLAYAAMLGWSPAFRNILKRKRKSDPTIDEVEDGGRAQVIDEAIAALVFAEAQAHSFYDGVTHVDLTVLRAIKLLTRDLEVSCRSMYEWEEAILRGFDVWREITARGGGEVDCDLLEGTIEARELVE